METLKKPLVVTFLALILSFCDVSLATVQMKMENQKRTYIVHVDKSKMPASFEHHSAWYESCLKSVSDSAKMIYIYDNVHGFSTRLTSEEARLLKSQHGVLEVLPEQRYQIHTTRTPHFLGLDKISHLIIPTKPNATSDVIIGVIDTGIWPESKSFDDAGMGPIPKTWKGECETGVNFTTSNCNKKLIGARFYFAGYESSVGRIHEIKEFKSPRDSIGHGTHTASTMAGSSVKGANLLGFASGTARGMATHARVAVYKACWGGGVCVDSDVLAAIDKAISDDVNILSMSLGSRASEYYRDSMAIGAFAAMETGILVSCSAGNSGPDNINNVAPWITTVGASTLDRDFPAYVSLGNRQKYPGTCLYRGSPLPDTPLPFIYAANASDRGSGFCEQGSLMPEKVKGKIVLCDIGEIDSAGKGYNVKSAGGLGMVVANGIEEGEDRIANAHLLPATAVGFREGTAMKNYLSSDPNPTATIEFKGTKLRVQPAPVIVSFSSRGPNPITPQILKPDLIAPGVNILAAWSRVATPTGLKEDKRRVDFNVESGTSMSCPHVSGLAALIKSVHPDWSPAVIRSALMTTAYTTYKNGQVFLDSATEKPSTPFDYGAGHVNPVNALNPGLVYNLTVDDYLGFLCAVNYTADMLKIVTRRKSKCDQSKQYRVTDLNYPSFAVVFDSVGVIKHTRTLTNVGPAGTYKVSVKLETPSVKTSVEPEVLSFREKEKRSHTVTFTSIDPKPEGIFGFGHLEWSNGQNVVGSPITFTWN